MNEIKCQDPVFGEMSYNHRWYKRQKVKMFEKTWEIFVVARAYSGKAITKEQRDSYSLFSSDEAKYIHKISDQIKSFINKNLHVFAENWLSARYIESTDELAEVVTPRTLLVKQDGETIMLFDCVWDYENGIGIKIIPNVEIGVQDLFL